MDADQWMKPRLYEAPSRVLAQALDGDLSLDNARRAFTNPESLPLEQLETLGEMTMPNQFLAGAVDLATNPFVLLALVTSPVGAGAGRSVFSRAGAKTWLGQNKGRLRKISFLTPMQAYGGTGAPEAAMAIENRLRGFKDGWVRRQTGSQGRIYHVEESAANLLDALQKVRPNLKIISLDPNEHTGPARRFLQEVATAMHARSAGLDQDLTRTTKEVLRDAEITYADGSKRWASEIVAERGTLTQKLLDEVIEDELIPAQGSKFLSVRRESRTIRESVLEQAIYDADSVEAILQSVGPEAFQYMDDMQEAMRMEFVKAIGDVNTYQKTGQFVFDERRLDRFIRSVVSTLEDTGEMTKTGKSRKVISAQGMEALHSLLDPNLVQDILHRSKDMDEFQLRGMLKDQMRDFLNPDDWDLPFMSRNLMEANPVVDVTGRRIRETMGRTEQDFIREAPGHAFYGVLTPRTANKMTVHLDDLEFGRQSGLLSEHGLKEMDRLANQSRRQWSTGKPGNRATYGHRMDFHRSSRKFMDDIHETRVMHTEAIDPDILRVDREAAASLRARKLDIEKRDPSTWTQEEADFIAWADTTSFQLDFVPGKNSKYNVLDNVEMAGEDADNMTYTQFMNITSQRLRNKDDQEILRKVMLPGALMKGGTDVAVRYAAAARNRERWHALSKSHVPEFLEKVLGEPLAKPIREWMEARGDYSVPLVPQARKNLPTSLLYAGHLGLNAGSAMLNLMQPLLFGPSLVGAGDLLGAYVDSLREMYGYAKRRVNYFMLDPKNNWRMSDAQKTRMIHDSFEFAGYQRPGVEGVPGSVNLLGIGPDAITNIDHAIVTAGGLKKGPVDTVIDLTMKLFEKSEWMNRNVTAHMMKRNAMRRGINYKHHAGFAADVERAVLEFQFGSHNMNQPLMFNSEVGLPLLSHPMGRMFLTFPIRTLTTVLHTLPRMGAEDPRLFDPRTWARLSEDQRFMGIPKIEGPMVPLIRAMGWSAGIYEVSKATLDFDVGRGLLAESTFGLFESLKDDRDPTIYNPPILDMSKGIISGIYDNDFGKVFGEASRFIPGSVAVKRALELSGAEGFRRHVDYSDPNEMGEFPVYRDGRLERYASMGDIFGRALGIDFGKFNEPGAFSRYLRNQQQEISEAKMEVLRLMGAGEHGKASRLRREFKDQHGFELMISANTIRNYLKSQETPKLERSLQSLDRNLRETARGIVEGEGWIETGGGPDLTELEENFRRAKELGL